MADEIQDTIETLAKEGFASTSFSQGSSSQSAKSLPELIEADRYLKGEKAKKPRFVVKRCRTIRPSSSRSSDCNSVPTSMLVKPQLSMNSKSSCKSVHPPPRSTQRSAVRGRKGGQAHSEQCGAVGFFRRPGREGR